MTANERKKVLMYNLIAAGKDRAGESACAILFRNEAYRLQHGPWVCQPDVKFQEQPNDTAR